jgi:tetratricopeptide (TPR) repeat protein
MRGRCFQIEGKTADAEAAFETAHRIDPTDTEARLELAKLILTRIRIERRLPSISVGTDGDETKFNDLPHETPEMARKRGRALDLLKGIKEETDFPAGLTAMGRGEFQEAADRLEKYTRVEAWDASALLLEGICRYYVRDFDRAEKALTRSLSLTPDPDALFRRAQVWFERKELRRAEEDLTRILERSPRDIRALRWRGHARSESGNLEGALADYLTCTELTPDDFAAWGHLGRLRYMKNDHAGALRDFIKACELGPGEAWLLYNRGNARYGLSDLAGAIADYDLALELDPSFARAYANRGRAKKALGKHAEAIADLDEALKLEPRNVPALSGRGYSRFRLNDLEGARKDLDAALEVNPGLSPALYHRALVRKAQGDWTGARRDADRAVELQPKNAHYHVDRGLILEGVAAQEPRNEAALLAEALEAITLGSRFAPIGWERAAHVAGHLKRIRGKLEKLENR